MLCFLAMVLIWEVGAKRLHLLSRATRSCNVDRTHVATIRLEINKTTNMKTKNEYRSECTCNSNSHLAMNVIIHKHKQTNIEKQTELQMFMKPPSRDVCLALPHKLIFATNNSGCIPHVGFNVSIQRCASSATRKQVDAVSVACVCRGCNLCLPCSPIASYDMALSTTAMWARASLGTL